MSKLIPFAQYEVGDRVMIRLGEEPGDPLVYGAVHSMTWNSFTREYQYDIVVSGLEGNIEAPKVFIVHEFEIWGMAVGAGELTMGRVHPSISQSPHVARRRRYIDE